MIAGSAPAGRFTRRTARSLSASEPTTSHSSSMPALVIAVIFEAPETTCSLVRMMPSGSMIAPDPRDWPVGGAARVEAEEEVVEDRGAAAQALLGRDVHDGGGDLFDDLDDLAAAGRERGGGRQSRGEPEGQDRPEGLHGQHNGVSSALIPRREAASRELSRPSGGPRPGDAEPGRVPANQLSIKDFRREGVGDLLLDESLEGPRAEGRVVAPRRPGTAAPRASSESVMPRSRDGLRQPTGAGSRRSSRSPRGSSRWKTMTSSIRLKNSGRKCRRSASSIFALISSSSARRLPRRSTRSRGSRS